ncbi:MAG: porin family protein [Bacteroidetes bacterium]|nr:porin family protein [Bacteroidota bacterium]
MKYFACLLIAGTCLLQTTQAQSFKLGVKVGGNMNKIEGKSFNDGFKFAYHAGAFAEINFNKKWGIQPEVLWNQMGGVPSNFQTVYGQATNVNISSLFSGDNVFKLDYLSIPILLRYTTVGGLFTFNVGPQFGIVLQQDKTLIQSGQDAFKSGDFSMVAGLQLNLLMLRVYGRYNIGLTNINNIDKSDKWTSQQLQVGLGIKL